MNPTNIINSKWCSPCWCQLVGRYQFYNAN